MSQKITIMEVGPRDGLQSQSQVLSLGARKHYIELLMKAGVKNLEAGAFVRPDRVPQMASSGDLLKKLDLQTVKAYFLVPNEKGLEEACKAGVREIAVFTACTDGFNEKNIGMNLARSKDLLQRLVPLALREGLAVRGYLSVVWGCPFDGKPKSAKILEMTEVLLSAGCFEVSLGDTIGLATPREVKEVLALLLKEFATTQLAVHFHDTRGMAIANVCEALAEGIRTVDASSGGLGGCPFAPNAAGNVATEEVVYLARGLQFETGIDLAKLAAASRFIYGELGIQDSRLYASRVLQSLA